MIRGLVSEDIERFRGADPATARGEFPALCLTSDALRRSALEFRNDQAAAIASAITDTTPEISQLTALAHASALVAVIQAVTEQIGAAVLAGTDPTAAADALRARVDDTLTDAAATFDATRRRAAGLSSRT